MKVEAEKDNDKDKANNTDSASEETASSEDPATNEPEAEAASKGHDELWYHLGYTYETEGANAHRYAIQG